MKFCFLVLWLRLISTEASKTVIDLLSSEERFSDMIYLLQESRMIPIINRLTSCTLLVLTNKDLEDLDEKYPNHYDKERLVRYHLLDGNLTTSTLKKRSDNLPLLETWLGRNGSLGIPDPLGPGRGQKVRVSISSSQNSFRKFVLIGNVKIVEENIMADNGIIHIVDQYLVPPQDVLKTVQSLPNLKRFTNMLNMTPTLLEAASNPKPHSLFIWSDESLESQFNSVELKYMESTSFSVSAEDRYLLLGTAFLTVSDEFSPVLYVQSLEPGHAIYTFNLAGDPVVIKRPLDAKNTLLYNEIEVEVEDILTTSGVIHILKEVIKPLHLSFNPIKYMIGLGSERFAATINNTSFRDFLLNPGAKYTVLVPPDDSFDIINFENTHASLDLIKYHLVKGEYDISDFNRVTMISTLLNDEFLGNRSQRIKVVPGKTKGQILFNSESSLLKGGVTLGDISMQKISVVLTPPLDIIDTISHDAELSTFYQLLQVSGLQDEVTNIHGITAFIPTDEAFQADSQKLLLTFLLKKSSLSILQDFIRYCLLTQLVFSTELNPKKMVNQFPTYLKNEPIQVIPNQDQAESPILSAHNNLKKSWDIIPKIISSDVFIRTGVIHKTSAMLAPKSRYPYLTARNFIKGNNADTFIMLLNRANMSHLLDGPCRSLSGECDDPNQAYTVLVPTQQAWSGLDTSKLENDPALLKRTLQFHFLTQRIPGRLDRLARTLSISTLSTDLPFLKVVFFSSTSSDSNIKTNALPHIKLRTSGAPAPMFSWEAQVPLAGQAHDLSVIFVDNVMFISQLPTAWSSFFTSFFSIILLFMVLGFIVYAGYRGHFNFIYPKLCYCMSVLQNLIVEKSQAFYNWCRGYNSIPDDA